MSGSAKGSATSGPDGTYSFGNLLKGSYTVKPSMTEYTFAPQKRKITLNKNATGQDFAGTKK